LVREAIPLRWLEHWDQLRQKAGQTALHLRVHLIPRYQEGIKNPAGGAKNVLPKGNCLRRGRACQASWDLKTLALATAGFVAARNRFNVSINVIN
jgi:hypothetical protein